MIATPAESLTEAPVWSKGVPTLSPQPDNGRAKRMAGKEIRPNLRALNTSVDVIGWIQALGPREDTCQLPRIMNQERKMLGADPKIRALEPEGDEWNLLSATLANEASCRFLGVVGHGILERVITSIGSGSEFPGSSPGAHRSSPGRWRSPPMHFGGPSRSTG
jgi:hypothetical protein